MLYPAELRGLKVSQRFLAGAGFLWAPRIHYCFRRLGQQLRNLYGGAQKELYLQRLAAFSYGLSTE